MPSPRWRKMNNYTCINRHTKSKICLITLGRKHYVVLCQTHAWVGKTFTKHVEALYAMRHPWEWCKRCAVQNGIRVEY